MGNKSKYNSGANYREEEYSQNYFVARVKVCSNT